MRMGLVLTKVGSIPPKRVLASVRGVKGVADAYAVFGRFDIVVFIQADDYFKLKDIAGDIARIEGIKSTETLIHGD
jgi:DNA-binding Lrp family transcriptional regulator